MAANIGQMFYTGDVPWHGLGTRLDGPATLDEALKAGELDWKVGHVDLQTTDDPPSPVSNRRAIVRLDRPAGDPGRVLGVAHRGFVPVQNRAGGQLFDAIFGHGKPVYHTGGYLERGQVVWLLAEIPNHQREIGADDVVAPFALFANSHDGSMAFHIRLTTVRVVCWNTLSKAIREKQFGKQFRRSHSGSLYEHAQAAQDFFAATLKEFDHTTEAFKSLATKRCDDTTFNEILTTLFPDPARPRNADQNRGLRAAWEQRLEDARAARKSITDLRQNGKGSGLIKMSDSYWGVLNAITEFIDHHKALKSGSRLSYALLGDGMDLKTRAYNLIHDKAAAV